MREKLGFQAVFEGLNMAATALGVGLLFSILIAGAGGSAFAQTTQTPTADATPLSAVTVVAPGAVSELVVNGRRRCRIRPGPGVQPSRPQVVSTYPAQGAVVAPGYLFVRVTFDQRMSPCGFILGYGRGKRYPELLAVPAFFTPDYRTFYFATRTDKGGDYGMRFNTDHLHNFRSIFGVGADEFDLDFKTSKDPLVMTATQALAGDPLSDGVSQHRQDLITLWVPRYNFQTECGHCDGFDAVLMVGPKVAEVSDAAH